MRKNSFVVDLKQFHGKLCKNCEGFIKKFKPWDENKVKVPKVAIVKVAECKKCRMVYNIYKGMVWPIPMATQKEEREIEKQFKKDLKEDVKMA